MTAPTGLWLGAPHNASRLAPTRPGEHRLWVCEHFPHDDDKQWRMSVGDAIAQYAGVGAPSDVIASIDSALNQHLLTETELDEVFAVLPRRLRRLRTSVNGLAGSGLETIFRLAAAAEGWRVDVQVRVRGVGNVDILIDGWLVIELDGAQWHDGEKDQDEDRRRDAELTLLGYRWHRFRYHQVMDNLPMCLDVVRTILASGRPRVVL